MDNKNKNKKAKKISQFFRSRRTGLDAIKGFFDGPGDEITEAMKRRKAARKKKLQNTQMPSDY